MVKHIDDTLSKIEMNADGELIISGVSHWCLIRSLTKDLSGYCGDTNATIKEIYGYSSSNGDAFNTTNKYRQLLWKRTEPSLTQLRIEKLEKQQREIADKIAELRKEIK